jgi:DNA end-binding protein Ku
VPDDELPNEEAEASAPAGRPFWSGTLSFGLVSIPVGLFPATRRAGVALRMLAPDGTPLARRYYCPEDGGELSGDDLVRGYELDDGSYVIVTDEELEAVDPKKSRDIDLRVFVPGEQIDPLYFDRSYVLAADSDSTKAYRLLAELMERTGRAGIATFVMREKEYLIAIFAQRGILRAETLRFHDEVRSAEDLDLPAAKQADSSLVTSFARAIGKLAADELDVEQLRGDRIEALHERIEQKRKRGEDVVTGEEIPAAANAEVIDLMEVLKRSLQGAEGRGEGRERERAERASERAEARPKRARGEARSRGGRARGERREAHRAGQHGAHARGPRKPAKVSPRESDLSELSKDELLERARELHVSGRSHMSKSELVRAVRNAG